MKNLNNPEILKKAVNAVASLCTCDMIDMHFQQVWNTLKGYDLVYECSNCKHYFKDCDVPMEWHCLKQYPPEFYEDKRSDTSTEK